MSKKEQKVVEVLKRVGIPKNEAKFLFYLFNKSEVFARGIEIGADLRQPEVSNAAKWLVNKKLIKFAAVKKTGGKGRPLFVYSLSKPNDEIVEIIDNMFIARIHLLESDMKKFETLFGVESHSQDN